MAEYLLKVEHLDKSYGNKRVLYDISFDVDEGGVLSFSGPSWIG